MTWDYEKLEQRERDAEALRRKFKSVGKLGEAHVWTAAGPDSFLPIIDMSAWDGEAPPRRSLWGDWLPVNTTTMLTGPGGVGKSLFEQALCTHVALGQTFLGMDTTQRNTLYVTCEDDHDELWRRQKAICAAIGVPISEILGRLHLVSLTGDAQTSLLAQPEPGKLAPTKRWEQLRATCISYEIGLYAFDNATDAMAGDHNDVHEVAEFVNLLTGLAIEMDGVAMILHHPNKAGDDWLGSVAWHNKVRSRLIVKPSDNEDDHDSRTIESPKANYGPSGGRIHFKWWNGTFVRDEDIPADQRAEMDELIRMNGESKAFMRCLAICTEQRRAVSHHVGANYAPKIFAGMPEARGVKQKAFAGAMERLLHLGEIELDAQLWQRENRVWKYGIKACTDPRTDPLHQTAPTPS